MSENNCGCGCALASKGYNSVIKGAAFNHSGRDAGRSGVSALHVSCLIIFAVSLVQL